MHDMLEFQRKKLTSSITIPEIENIGQDRLQSQNSVADFNCRRENGDM